MKFAIYKGYFTIMQNIYIVHDCAIRQFEEVKVKNLLSIKDLSKGELLGILDLADDIKENGMAYRNKLQDKTILTIFPDSSLRTRVTFEAAIKEMGAVHIFLPPASIERKEPIDDICRYLDNWIDMLVIRYPSYQIICSMADLLDVPVINAMTSENHPCEILTDLQTLRDLRGSFDSLKFVFVGGKGNICNTWFEAAGVLDLNMTLICPLGYELDEDTYSFAKRSKGDIKITNNLEEGLSGADVVLTDGWPGGEAVADAFTPYRISSEVMALAKPDALLNPCPPMTRGHEVTEEVLNSSSFIGYKAKENLLHAQKAILLYCFGMI